MATLEEFKAECRSELQALRDGDGIFKQVNNERLPISDDDFEQIVLFKIEVIQIEKIYK